MSRLLSVALTEQQVRDQTKTETRRLGWRHAHAGMQLSLVRKAMGRKRRDGTVQPLVRLNEVVVTEVRREPLHAITEAGVAAEGFPHWTPEQFIDFFTSRMKCDRNAHVTVIRWRYLGWR